MIRLILLTILIYPFLLMNGKDVIVNYRTSGEYWNRDSVLARKVKQITIPEYNFKKSPNNSLSHSLQKRITFLANKCTEDFFFISFGMTDEYNYIMAQSWPLWLLVDAEIGGGRSEQSIVGVVTLKIEDKNKYFIPVGGINSLKNVRK